MNALQLRLQDSKKMFKACGIRASLALEDLPVDMIGFNFVPGSKRFLSLEQAKDIQIPDEILRVGIFQNASQEYIQERVAACALDVVQLHGEEDDEVCRYFGQKGLGVIKALPAKQASQWSQFPSVDLFIFDGVKGGSGESYDYSLLKDLTAPFLVAGGVSQSNALQILATLPQARGLDVASGVDNGHNIDEKKMRDILDTVLNYLGDS